MTTRMGPLVAGLAAALTSVPALAAYDAFVTISAATPAAATGAPLQAHRHVGGSPFLEFALSAPSPRDATTGQASGKRQYKPITIVKEWGALSPDLGRGEINCNAIMIAATLPGGQRLSARSIAPARAGECRYAVGLPSSTAVRTFLQVTAPGITGPWTFQAAPTAVEIRAGQTLSAHLSAQGFGEGGRFSVEWGSASPQFFTAKAPAKIPYDAGTRH